MQQRVTPGGEQLADKDLDYIYLNTFLQNDWQRAMISDISQDLEIREPREIPKQASHDFLLKPEWLEPSDTYGWRATARNVMPLLAFLGIVPALSRVNAFAPWILAPAIGLFLYRITVVMHDCTHHTLFVSRTINARVGLLLGALSGVDFHGFCVQHWRHHRLYGRAGDPQGFHYLDLAKMNLRRSAPASGQATVRFETA